MDIPFLTGASRVVPILDGFSGDRKFLVEKGGENFLLRTFPLADFAAKELEAHVLRSLLSLGVRCSEPLELGRHAGEAYGLYSFFEGEDGAKALPKMPPESQFRVGQEAGRELLKIHSLAAPSGVSSWSERKLTKYRRYSAAYLAGAVKFPGDQEVLNFCEERLPLMENRPNLFQHDDYHLRNLIVHGGKLNGVIDFNRHDWGDPVHEFLKIGQFSAVVSEGFCLGQLHGYFGVQDPGDSFWELYSLYVGMALISSVVWQQAVAPHDMPVMREIIDRVMADHDGFAEIRPRWLR